METTQIKEGKKARQIIVWPGTIVGFGRVTEFRNWFKEEFGVECEYLEEIKTLPDKKDGRDVEGTGGRNDLFFSVTPEDSMKIAVKRLLYGMRWWEDVLGNDGGALYPKEILEKYEQSWAWGEGTKLLPKEEEKPECELTGQNGNVFNIIGLVQKALKRAGQSDKAKEFGEKAFSSESYDAVIALAMEYVEVT